MKTTVQGHAPIALANEKPLVLHALNRIRSILPEGGSLPPDVWRSRHHGILVLLWIHAAGIFIYSVVQGYGLLHGLQEGGVIAFAAALATVGPGGRRVQSAMASLGLLSSSAVLIHLSDGYIEMHFHFFVMVVVISLYQDWVPFLLAIGYVVLHHGVVGVLDPRAVYNHFDALGLPVEMGVDPWALCVRGKRRGMVNWRLSEDAHARAEEEKIAAVKERAARVEAEAAVRMRDEFLSIAAHELKTPVTGLLGFSELAQYEMDKRESSDELRHAVDVIQRQSTKLSGLVSQLLNISQIEGGKVALNRSLTDVVRVAQDVARTARSNSGQHDIAVVGPQSLQAMVDPLRFEEVLTNLVENAVKFSPSGGAIEIDICEPEPWRFRVAVSDHGIGIPPAHRAGIFDRFYQAHSGDFYGGMGLGLYISKQIVDLHGGRLVAEFPAAGGTRFVAELPNGLADDEQEEEDAA